MRVCEEAILDCSVFVPANFALPSRVVPRPKLLRSTVNTPLGCLLDPLGELGLGDQGVVVLVDLVDHKSKFDPRLLRGQTGKLFSLVPQKGFMVKCLVVFTFVKDHYT